MANVLHYCERGSGEYLMWTVYKIKLTVGLLYIISFEINYLNPLFRQKRSDGLKCTGPTEKSVCDSYIISQLGAMGSCGMIWNSNTGSFFTLLDPTLISLSRNTGRDRLDFLGPEGTSSKEMNVDINLGMNWSVPGAKKESAVEVNHLMPPV